MPGMPPVPPPHVEPTPVRLGGRGSSDVIRSVRTLIILLSGDAQPPPALSAGLLPLGSVVSEVRSAPDLVVLYGCRDLVARIGDLRSHAITAETAILAISDGGEVPELPIAGVIEHLAWPRESALLERRCRLLLELTARRRDDHFRWLVDHANEAVWRVELAEPCATTLPVEEQVAWFFRHGLITQANPAMATMYGLASADDLIGMPLANLLLPDNARNHAFLAAAVGAGYRLIDAESVERDVNGAPRWFLNSLFGEVADGLVHGAWGTSRDITAFRLVDQRLAQSEDRLRLVVEHSAEGIVMADEAGVIRLFNPAAERMHGVAFRQIASPDWVATFGLEDLDGRTLGRHEVPLWRALQGETVDNARWVVCRPDGSRRVLVGTATPLTRGDGSRAGAVLICRDVSEQDATERALRERIAHTRAIVDSALDAVVTIDASDRIVDWNPQAEAIFGWSASAAIGQVLPDLIIPPRYRERHRVGMARYLASDEGPALRKRLELSAVRRDGTEFPVELSIVPTMVDGRVLFCGYLRDITEAKRAETSLRASEARFRQLAETIREVFYIRGLDGRDLVYVSPAYAEIWGRSTDSLHADPLSFLQAVHADDRPRVEAALARQNAGEATVEEYRVVRPDGAERWVWDRCYPVMVDGRAVHVAGIAEDVTERRRAEDGVRSRERLLTLITDALPSPIAYVDRDCRFRFLNRSYPGWHQRPAGGVLNADMREVLGEQHWASVAPYVARAFAGETVTFDRSFVRPDGSERWVQISYIPDRDRDERVNGFVVLILDTTERTRTAQRDHLLAEATVTMARTLDPQAVGRVLAECCVPVLGDWAALEIDGEAVFVHHRHASDEPRVRAAVPMLALAVTPGQLGRPLARPIAGIASAIGVGILARDEWRARLWLACDESRQIHDAGDAELARELARRAALAMDRALLLQEARTARDQAERTAGELARSNAELEQFAYVSSHDLKEPLRMVTMYLDLLERRYGGTLDGKAQGYVGYARDSAARMQRLIEDLLAYARPVARDTAEPVDANAVMAAVIADLRASIAAERATITTGRLPALRVDRTRLGQLLQNLVGNALKYRSERPPEITITATTDADAGCTIDVADNGIGIEPAYHQRIFEVFQRLHGREQYAGTGIGLAICKKIVDQLGGRIWVESELGQGSVFRVTLPAALVEFPAGDQPADPLA